MRVREGEVCVVTHNSYVTTQNRLLEVLRVLINICANSLKIKKLVVEEPCRRFNMRPQLHLFISSPYGEFKSTLLNEISNAYPSKLYTNLTFPSLIGSIDRDTKQIMPAAAWECRNKIMLLDEYMATRPSLVSEALLQLLESQYYSRKVAMYSANKEEVEGDLYFRVRDGNIEVKTRFSCIIATMKNIRKAREYGFKALLSRCVPIRYELTKDEIEQVLDGKLLFKKEEYDVEEDVVISTSDYMKIREILNRHIEERGIKGVEEVYARAVGDCCRAFAVLQKHDEQLYKDILELKVTFR
jgi:hypothetical protein